MLTSIKTRQPVLFDISNKEHRNHFLYFLTNSKWASDAPLFALEDGWLQIPDMIKHKLTLHYLQKEFK